MRRLVALLAAAVVAAALPPRRESRPSVSYGIQDDAWLTFGPGTVEERVATLQGLGLDIVRVTVRWDAVEEVEGHIRLDQHRCRPRVTPAPRGSRPW